ncbi:MAG: DUF1330 domain-containing protein [Saprospiraceae bacterium]|nr:DUF1330 domain-containing protein [Saprospiraceae bacterium]
MHLTNQVMATTEVFVDFIQNYPSGTPLVMLNILKFKARTDDGEETGEEAYTRYGQNVAPLLAKVGAKILWGGNVKRTLIGDLEVQPDRILVVYYPSKEAFVAMSTSEDYAKIGGDREKALEYGGLIVTETMDFMSNL